ncbi:MAG: hypothetical protein CMO80_04150 [Verrucomicrobiales bacterium]|nr:hypothetical protein [Verrucomicrobiales bacterium]|tara:strand:+ start:4049 stop:4987 length:939 start_codon:yes stop_codon:yes gene_type:complete
MAVVLAGCAPDAAKDDAELRKVGASTDSAYIAEKTKQLKLIGVGYQAYCETNGIGPENAEGLLAMLEALKTPAEKRAGLKKALDENRFYVIWNVNLTNAGPQPARRVLAWDDNLQNNYPGQVLNGDMGVRSVSPGTFLLLKKLGDGVHATKLTATASPVLELTPTAMAPVSKLPPITTADTNVSILDTMSTDLLDSTPIIDQFASMPEVVDALGTGNFKTRSSAIAYLQVTLNRDLAEEVNYELVSLLGEENREIRLMALETLRSWATPKGVLAMEKALQKETNPQLVELGKTIAAEFRKTNFVGPVAPPGK